MTPMRVGMLALAAVVVASCTSGSDASTTTTADPATTTTVDQQAEPDLYVNLVWHQHQPSYPKDADGRYTRPWVRVHATKDYLDMAEMVTRYPGLHVTFNLTPTLLMQLEDIAAGAQDVYRAVSATPAASLDEEQRRFLVERFFDVNPLVIARFPRYQELATDRERLGIDGAAEAWGEQDFLDLQVLFDLAWTDPDRLAEAPLADVVAKGRSFAESDKEVVATAQLAIVQDVIPLHTRLWDEGVIEVTTTPFAHPILPLIADTDLALAGDPVAVLPSDRFRFLQDADEQVRRGLDEAERLLGTRPSGMWPGEGAVAQLVTDLYPKNDVGWIASGEEVLAASLGIGSFTRNGEGLIDHPELLYRPWMAQAQGEPAVPMFFRDGTLSDLIGFEYSGSDADEAAADFMARLDAIRGELQARGALGDDPPPVVTVILDGENAWEHYPNDGKDFLDALYTALTTTDWVGTITPSEYLSRFGEPEALPDVWPGAWFQPNFSTWIGEEEEAAAWGYLYRVRQDLRRAEQSGAVDEDALASARVSMLLAEGSDWFWWYGSDQDSGNDDYFDGAFRELLGQVYDALAMARPAFIAIPIIPQPPLAADVPASGLQTITVDGDLSDWSQAGRYLIRDSEGYGFGFDADHLFLGWVGSSAPDPLVIYLGGPRGSRSASGIDGEVLGFGATGTLVVSGDAACLYARVPSRDEVDGRVGCAGVDSARSSAGVEVAIPLELLGAITSGDIVSARGSADGEVLPAAGPMAFQVPDISDVDVFLEVEDPAGDDHGPGGFTYPLDPVFIDGSFDLTRFSAGTEGEDLVFTFEVAAPILNPWGSPRGLSVQTFDVYVDTDPGSGTGARTMIPGRNAALGSSDGWEFAVTVEGWDPALYVADEQGMIEETKPTFGVLAFGDSGRVVVRLPLSLLGDGDPTTWGYAAALLSQEGFPSPGVRRVRDVRPTAEQWIIGGGSGAINETRILDVAWPVPGEQEAMLSGYAPVAGGSVTDLEPDDFATVFLLTSQPR
jgi:alpha-amylase/alpha-mannosidase (GH57 family)